MNERIKTFTKSKEQTIGEGEIDFAIVRKILNDTSSERQLFNKEIVEKYTPLVERVCWSIFKNYSQDKDSIKDIVQNTFIRIQEKLSTYRGESALKYWILQIARNVTKRSAWKSYAAESVKNIKSFSSFPEYFDIERHEFPESEEPEFGKEEEFFFQLFWNEEFSKKVFKGKEKLRNDFLMFYRDQKSHNEIGKESGKAASTSRSNLTRALATIKEYLKDNPLNEKDEI